MEPLYRRRACKAATTRGWRCAENIDRQWQNVRSFLARLLIALSQCRDVSFASRHSGPITGGDLGVVPRVRADIENAARAQFRHDFVDRLMFLPPVAG